MNLVGYDFEGILPFDNQFLLEFCIILAYVHVQMQLDFENMQICLIYVRLRYKIFFGE